MALESINILKRERRHIANEKQKQMDDLAYTTKSISFPKACLKINLRIIVHMDAKLGRRLTKVS